MLAYIPVRFDLYRIIRPHLRWTLQCLVGSPIAPADASRLSESSLKSPASANRQCPAISQYWNVMARSPVSDDQAGPMPTR
jgi:hypothetical protein